MMEEPICLDVLMRTHASLLPSFKKRFKRFNLGSGQIKLLITMQKIPGIELGQLCDRMDIDKTTAAKSMKKLIIKGLVEKKQDTSDLRRFGLYLTKKGKEMIPELKREIRKTNEALMVGFSSKEQEELIRLLKKLRVNIIERLE